MMRQCPYNDTIHCNKEISECFYCKQKENSDLTDLIIKAFIEILDAVDAKEIEKMTGLDLTRCEEIKRLWEVVINKMDKHV